MSQTKKNIFYALYIDAELEINILGGYHTLEDAIKRCDSYKEFKHLKEGALAVQELPSYFDGKEWNVDEDAVNPMSEYSFDYVDEIG